MVNESGVLPGQNWLYLARRFEPATSGTWGEQFIDVLLHAVPWRARVDDRRPAGACKPSYRVIFGSGSSATTDENTWGETAACCRPPPHTIISWLRAMNVNKYMKHHGVFHFWDTDGKSFPKSKAIPNYEADWKTKINGRARAPTTSDAKGDRVRTVYRWW